MAPVIVYVFHVFLCYAIIGSEESNPSLSVNETAQIVRVERHHARRRYDRVIPSSPLGIKERRELELEIKDRPPCGLVIACLKPQDNVDPVVDICIVMPNISDEWDRNFQSALERSVMLCGL